ATRRCWVARSSLDAVLPLPLNAVARQFDQPRRIAVKVLDRLQRTVGARARLAPGVRDPHERGIGLLAARAVAADRLADRLFRALLVEDVVRDLESEPDVFAETL